MKPDAPHLSADYTNPTVSVSSLGKLRNLFDTFPRLYRVEFSVSVFDPLRYFAKYDPPTKAVAFKTAPPIINAIVAIC